MSERDVVLGEAVVLWVVLWVVLEVVADATPRRVPRWDAPEGERHLLAVNLPDGLAGGTEEPDGSEGLFAGPITRNEEAKEGVGHGPPGES